MEALSSDIGPTKVPGVGFAVYARTVAVGAASLGSNRFNGAVDADPPVSAVDLNWKIISVAIAAVAVQEIPIWFTRTTFVAEPVIVKISVAAVPVGDQFVAVR